MTLQGWLRARVVGFVVLATVLWVLPMAGLVWQVLVSPSIAAVVTLVAVGPLVVVFGWWIVAGVDHRLRRQYEQHYPDARSPALLRWLPSNPGPPGC